MASNETATPGLRKTCFVVMGFGRKTDFETGRTLDLDKTYKNVIKPAVTNAGLACIRADEIVHSGPLDMPRYDQLLKADIVIVDISTLNSSALYELGVRHALRPHGTIVIAEDGMRTFPFDINHILVRQYHHLGHGLDYDEVERFRKELAYTIKELLSRQIVDSPVYMSLEKLQPPTLGEDTAQAMAAARPIAAPEGEGSAQVPVTPPAPEPSPQSKALVLFVEQLEHAVADSLFADARHILTKALKFLTTELQNGHITNAPDIIERLVRTALKVMGPNRSETLTVARRIFEVLLPTRSNNPETLRLLGDIELAIFEEKKDVNRLRRARQAYERLYTIQRDYRSGITLAYLVTFHAEYRQDVLEKLIDIGFANRLRYEVVEAGKEQLARIDERYRTEIRLMTEQGLSWTPAVADEAAKEKLEVWGALAEAYYGIGDVDNYHSALDEAANIHGDETVATAAGLRIERLAPLLEKQSSLLAALKDNLDNEPDPAPL